MLRGFYFLWYEICMLYDLNYAGNKNSKVKGKCEKVNQVTVLNLVKKNMLCYLLKGFKSKHYWFLLSTWQLIVFLLLFRGAVGERNNSINLLDN